MKFRLPKSCRTLTVRALVPSFLLLNSFLWSTNCMIIIIIIIIQIIILLLVIIVIEAEVDLIAVAMETFGVRRHQAIVIIRILLWNCYRRIERWLAEVLHRWPTSSGGSMEHCRTILQPIAVEKLQRDKQQHHNKTNIVLLLFSFFILRVNGARLLAQQIVVAVVCLHFSNLAQRPSRHRIRMRPLAHLLSDLRRPWIWFSDGW